jgi:hypothetical protein
MAKGNVFKNRLTQMQAAANDAMTEYVPGGLKVPDDIYNARVQAELTESAAGNLMITRTFTIMEGDYQGLKIWDHIVLEKLDDDGDQRIPSYMGIIQSRRWLESMGIEFPEDDLGQLDEIITQVSDCAPACRIRSKTSHSKNTDDEYTHVTVLEVLYWDEEGEAAYNAGVEQPASEGEQEGEPEGEQEGTQEGEPEGEITFENLLTFAASQGIEELDDSMDGETIIATLLTYQYKANEITDEEREMLLAIGLPEEQIIEPVPKQVTIPKPAPKKASAKSAPAKSAPAKPALPPKRPAVTTPAKTISKKPPVSTAKKSATGKGKLLPRIGISRK